MGIPKWLDFAGCLEVTLVLRDYKTVTGKLVDFKDDRKQCGGWYWDSDDKKHEGFEEKYDHDKHDDHKKDDYDKYDDHKKDDYDHCDDHKKHDDKCCKPPKVDVKVDVEDKCDFILLELTRDAESVSLQEIEVDDTCGIEIEWVNVEFKKGSCIAVNVCDIIYAGVNAEVEKEEIVLGGFPTAADLESTT